MRDPTRYAPGRFQRLCGVAKLCRCLARLLGGRARDSAPALDARMRRDIGLPPDGPMGVSDVRADFDRRLSHRGQPWP